MATVAVIIAIPWWRPFFRNPTIETSPATNVAVTEAASSTEATAAHGDPARGAVLFKQSIGDQPACSTCHSLNDLRIVGPGLRSVGSHAGQRIRGKTAERYLQESIRNPNAYIVPDYPSGVMPSNSGQVLTAQQMDDLVAYLLSLK